MKIKSKNITEDTLRCEAWSRLSMPESTSSVFIWPKSQGGRIMHDIIKEKGPDRKMTYKFPNGEKIETYTESFIEILGRGLERVKMLFDLIDLGGDVDGESIHYIGKALLRDAEAQFNESYDFVEENFGSIEIERAIYHQLGIGGGERLGVVFKANNQGQGGIL